MDREACRDAARQGGRIHFDDVQFDKSYEAAGGGVAAAKVPARARDDAAIRRLWDISEQLTATSYPEPA